MRKQRVFANGKTGQKRWKRHRDENKRNCADMENYNWRARKKRHGKTRNYVQMEKGNDEMNLVGRALEGEKGREPNQKVEKFATGDLKILQGFGKTGRWTQSFARQQRGKSSGEKGLRERVGIGGGSDVPLQEVINDCAVSFTTQE